LKEKNKLVTGGEGWKEEAEVGETGYERTRYGGALGYVWKCTMGGRRNHSSREEV
jgi:hypothetical protein